MRETTLSLLLGLTIIVLCGVICWAVSPQEEPLPTFRQLQQQLVDLGEDIKVDGRMCEGWNNPEHSETLTAWGRQICRQHGIVDYRKWVRK